MFLLDSGPSDRTVVLSASDLTAAAGCEFAVLRGLDARLGRIERSAPAEDPMLERVASLGDKHEAAVLARYIEAFGEWNGDGGVATVARPRGRLTRAVLESVQRETVEVLAAGPDVVYQAGFFDGRFLGWADFLVRGADGAWQVQDTKLARHAKTTALLQLAAYADQLSRAGFAVADRVALLLGSGATSLHRTEDLVPVFLHRRDRLQRLVDQRLDADTAVAWGASEVHACLRCEVCEPFLEASRDVLLVAGLSATQRDRLALAGVHTVEQLAAGAGPVEGIGKGTLAGLRAQARLQATQDAAGDGQARWELTDPATIGKLPVPDAGDIFFDFEGDPLWFDQTATADTSDAWGLEYLFGLVEAPVGDDEPVFRPFWAHDRAQEKTAMTEFMAYLAERRARHPGMHVYHYAAYERSALLRLAGRHGVGEDELDELLRAGVLVDLYATVRQCLRTGQRSYSLKKVEALYGVSHSGQVAKADESIVEYANACLLRDEGDVDGWSERLGEIAAYNQTDCVSTLRLRDWLLARGADTGVHPATSLAPDDEPDAEPVLDPATTRLLAFADADPDPESGTGIEIADVGAVDREAVAMVAAALGYHWREAKPFWWAHYDRLSADPAEWMDRRATLVADEVSVLEDWHLPPGGRARNLRRVLQLTGRLEPGSDLRAGTSAIALYDPPLPADAKTSERGTRGWRTSVEVVAVDNAGRDDDRDVLTVHEGGVKKDAHGPDELPMGLGPAPGPSTASLQKALQDFGELVLDRLPDLPVCAGIDLLRRTPPRTVSERGLVRADVDQPLDAAIATTLLDLDRSYLAVQGPPGTGKTYVGARVVRRLVEAGWKVAIVAQSHAAVENFLDEVITTGLAPTKVAKKPPIGSTATHPWIGLPTDFTEFFTTQHGGGFLIGGTAWDLTNPRRIPTGGYDLLVIDEAGQFSLANTLAVARATTRLLLLGDPQQLPQVSQGTHPAPVDQSALGWLSAGHDTLPDQLGYFLDTTYRMHPALCDQVSLLSYDRRLTAAPTAATRHLAGVAPGATGVPVLDHGRTVMSPAEADEVVHQVDSLIGRAWTDEHGTRPLEPADILVVAAYNAQVWAIRHALDHAGHRTTQVGTVDKFQGRQAPVVLISMAASSADEVPRGMDFLLDRHRLNVAISRGQWCARILHSPALADHLPTHPDQLENLGAFLRLCAGR